MAKAGTVDDAEKIMETMRAGDWEASFGKTSITGAKTWGLAAAFSTPIYLTRVQGGEIVTFGSLMGTLP